MQCTISIIFPGTLLFNKNALQVVYSTCGLQNNIWTSLWVPVDVVFFAHFPSNNQVFKRNRRISRIVLRGQTLLASSSNLRRPQRKREDTNKKIGSVRKTKTLNVQHPFWQISLPFSTNEAVELDRNGNVIVALISKIAVWSIAIVLIPSEIIKQSLTFLPTYNFIRHREVATKSSKYYICMKKFYLIFNDKYQPFQKNNHVIYHVIIKNFINMRPWSLCVCPISNKINASIFLRNWEESESVRLAKEMKTAT